tara:strand:+ start:1642 stop:2391 length:750 start_codon:yes stop_codon:yes gene_type:complete
MNMPVIKGNSTAAIMQVASENKVQETKAGGNFLKFDAKRTGEWMVGADNEGCTGEVIALNVGSLKHGYIQWHQKKANRRLVPLNQELPEPQEAIHYTDGKGKPQTDEASEARAFEAQFVTDGVGTVFESSTFGGRKAIDGVLAELFSRARQSNPYLFPTIELASDSYDHPEYGLTYSPVLKVVAWFDEEGNEEGAPAKAVEEKAAEPAKKTRAKKAAPAAEAEAEPEQTAEEAPEPDPAAAGRRRRRSA